MFRRCAPEILTEKYSYCIVGALRRRYFPIGEITGRILSAPTRSVPQNYRRKNFGALMKF